VEAPRDPCAPNPCGPYSVCKPAGAGAACSCQENYVGVPPGCRVECLVDSECPNNKACVQEKCRDPCPGTCGANAQCKQKYNIHGNEKRYVP
jgi:hypothetical protein